MGAAEIRQPRDNHTGVGDRLLKRCEMDAWVAGRVMGEGRQRLAIGLRNILSRDSATWSRQRRRGRRARTLTWPEFEVPVATFDCRFCSRKRCPYWTPEASGKPCAVTHYLSAADLELKAADGLSAYASNGGRVAPSRWGGNYPSCMTARPI